jgi:ribosomal protein L40E
MVFCSKCGTELPEDAYFCPKCGVRTRKGVEAGVTTTWVEVRDEFSKIGVEIEKAFTKAGKEIEKAFKTARESIKESIGEATIVCSHCGEKNDRGAKFCYNCGKEL